MAELHLPGTLTDLFSDLPRRIELDAPDVAEAVTQLEARWPGVRDRLCDPGPVLRQHIHVYVDKERADLDTQLEPRSRVDFIAAISGG
jgi:sulfur-carrier protein